MGNKLFWFFFSFNCNTLKILGEIYIKLNISSIFKFIIGWHKFYQNVMWPSLFLKNILSPLFLYESINSFVLSLFLFQDGSIHCYFIVPVSSIPINAWRNNNFSLLFIGLWVQGKPLSLGEKFRLCSLRKEWVYFACMRNGGLNI